MVTLPNLVMESPCLRPAESAGLPATTTITRAKGGPTASRGLASVLQNSDELCLGMTWSWCQGVSHLSHSMEVSLA